MGRGQRLHLAPGRDDRELDRRIRGRATSDVELPIEVGDASDEPGVRGHLSADAKLFRQRLATVINPPRVDGAVVRAALLNASQRADEARLAGGTALEEKQLARVDAFP